ncbi:MAG: DNA topoisomerase IB, partial [Actinomycetota bacterium]|nr:DNA topoisomerase IB [Actinomycetota bacterium]
FRTWNGTVLTAMLLADHDEDEDRDKAVVAVIKRVSEVLGNTPAVCRASYVDPRIIAKYERGVTIRDEVDRLNAKGSRKDFADRAGIERAVVELIT